MKVYAIQPDIAWEAKTANFAKVRDMLVRRGTTPGSLIVLPEMFSTGFSLNVSVTQQSEAREDEAFLAELAREYRSAVIGGVVSPSGDNRAYNQAVAFGPTGELLTRYTKMHPFSLGGEAECHAAGDVVTTFQYGGFTIAPFVCYDLRFPEIFRRAVKKGADLLVVMALWPIKRQQHWLTLLQARAIENMAYVVGVNRTGQEPLYNYAGRSAVVNPHGIIVGDAGEQEGILESEIDSEVVQRWRMEFPALRDARW